MFEYIIQFVWFWLPHVHNSVVKIRIFKRRRRKGLYWGWGASTIAYYVRNIYIHSLCVIRSVYIRPAPSPPPPPSDYNGCHVCLTSGCMKIYYYFNACVNERTGTFCTCCLLYATPHSRIYISGLVWLDTQQQQQQPCFLYIFTAFLINDICSCVMCIMACARRPSVYIRCK